MTETGSPDLPVFPQIRPRPFALPEDYARLRAQCPVSQVRLPAGRPAWLVTRHEDARRLLAASAVSVDRTHQNYPGILPQRVAFTQRPKGFLTWMDPPEHTLHRRMLASEFTVRRLQALRPGIQAVVDARIDEMLAGGRSADLVQALSLPVPTQVVCELLGVPYEDRELFQRRTAVIVTLDTSLEERNGALREIQGYLSGLVAAKESAPGDDLLSNLIEKYRQAGSYDRDHVTGVATILLTGGFETTANMISLGVVALLEHPEQRDMLAADPGLAPRVVDEMLRYFSVSDNATSRVALEDIEIDGVLIRAGEGVIASNAAANRDERAFENPEDLDITRDARRHLAFGYGIHQCLGQNLAHLELQLVYATLFTRVPTLRLAVPVDELAFKTDTSFYGIHEVPVVW